MPPSDCAMQPLSLRHYAFFWLSVCVAFVGAVWVLKGMLLPFVVGMAIAYLFGPAVSWMVSHQVSRTVAASLLLGGFLCAVFLVFSLVLPIAYREAIHLAAALPGYADRIEDYLTPYVGMLQDKFQMGDLSTFQDTLKNDIGRILRLVGDVLLRMAGGGQAVFSIFTFIFLTPVVAFFMMREWVQITGWIDNMIPRRSYDEVRSLLQQIDQKISGFVRGQMMVALILGAIYAIALMVAGLQYGFLIGLIAGALSIIPMFGSIVGLLIAAAVAGIQSHEWSYVGIIAAIFLVGQFLEGNIITPKIMGQSVGLHPLWILFSLMAGGTLFGILGMFLAVPVAAVIGVLASFALAQYRKSPYYGRNKLSEESKTP